jgi:hypothetical protein
VVRGRTIVPARALPDSELGGLNLAVEPSGVVLGRDSAAAPVLVRMFGPEPTRVAFVGGWWAGQILACRCLAHGAAIVVDALATPAPAQHGLMAGLSQWLTLDHWVGGSGLRVRPMASDASTVWPASASQPLLRWHDVGPAGPSGRPDLQAWQTQLIVLSTVTPASLPALSGVDIVLTQRLDPPEAALLGSALLLGPELVARISAMDNEMVAAFRGRAMRYVWLNPTPVERQIFG